MVGAGSAGCVLADRLSADGKARVLVLEAGPSDKRLPIRVPIGYGHSFHNPNVNWRYHTAPDPALNDRALYWPRGKCLGGSSSINAMVYCRGLPGDFEDWEAAGNSGWGPSEVAGVFDRIERRIDAQGHADGNGPLWVTDNSAQHHPLRRHFLAAAEETGFEAGDTATDEGIGPYQTTTRKGWRCSAADAFLRPAMRRRNLTVLTGAEAVGVDFEDGRAVAVRYHQRGAMRRAVCDGEIILTTGAIRTPQLLQVSGIGPGQLLRDMGLPVLVDNANVGGGLQDHMGVDYSFRCDEPTLNQTLGTLRGQIGAALQYLISRRGPFALSVNQMGGVVRSAPDLARPDMQLYFNPLSYTTVHSNRRSLLKPDRWPGFNFGFNPCRPTSRGRIDIASPDPLAAPRIVPNVLSTNEDVQSFVTGARLIERFLKTDALQRLITAPNGFTPTGADDEAILADARDRASTVFHACGTCRMAPRAAGGVVDPALRVWGVEGLRVADASVFPNITSANTNAPTIMTAMKAADIILSR